MFNPSRINREDEKRNGFDRQFKPWRPSQLFLAHVFSANRWWKPPQDPEKTRGQLTRITVKETKDSNQLSKTDIWHQFLAPVTTILRHRLESSLIVPRLEFLWDPIMMKSFNVFRGRNPLTNLGYLGEGVGRGKREKKERKKLRNLSNLRNGGIDFSCPIGYKSK